MRVFSIISALACVLAFHAQAKTAFYSFKGDDDGEGPYRGVIRDAQGNFYGVTNLGGKYGGCGGLGCGTVFKVSPDGTETVLHTFSGKDGGNPRAGLIMDSSENLFGTTYNGGRDRCGDDPGCGVVFKLAPDGTETVLYSFKGKKDGAHPTSELMLDEAGNLYGTTEFAGIATCFNGEGCGTAFRLSSTGELKILHRFKGGPDGALPDAGLVSDSSGNLYGTTSLGGGGVDCLEGYGCGTIYEIVPGGRERVVYAFDGKEGASPEGTLLRDSGGNFYGVAQDGNNIPSCAGIGCGSVFKFAADGKLTVLHAFDGSDGMWPSGSLIVDKAGNLYGNTSTGGAFLNCAGGCGTVYEVQPDGTESVLYNFKGTTDGRSPLGRLVADEKGNLYGTALRGGVYDEGSVFKIRN